MATKIYRATEADKSKARAIVDSYCEEIGVIVRDTPAGFDAYFSDGSGVWLAEKDGDVVGCIILRPIPIPGEKAAEVKRLYVLPSARGERLADQLLLALHASAKERYEWLYLDTKDDLLAAIRFYRRHGYEDCDRYNDNPQATIFMRKRME